MDLSRIGNSTLHWGLPCGLILDRMLGDPGGKWHPVAVFGRYASLVESHMYRPTKLAGVAYVVACVAPPVALGAIASRRFPQTSLALALATSLGGTTLEKAGLRMHARLESGDLVGARELVPWLCSRDPSLLDDAGIARATVESLAENTSDAASAPIFYAIFGAPAVVLHRAVNTLDAMVGYKSEKYREFGWAAAKLDDLLAWAPARLTAIMHVCASGKNWGKAVRAWREDAPAHPSPNAGPVEATAAAALGVQLGGKTHYSYGIEMRPVLGRGPAPDASTIPKAVRLSRRTQASMAVTAIACNLVYRRLRA